jgi:hypothetical protein
MLHKKSLGESAYGDSELIGKFSEGQSYTFTANGIVVSLAVNSINGPIASITLNPGIPPPSPTPTAVPTSAVAPCDSTLVVRLVTDWYPSETAWELKNTCTDEVIATSPSYSSMMTEYTFEVCVSSHHDFEFIISDTWGDGICKSNIAFILPTCFIVFSLTINACIRL